MDDVNIASRHAAEAGAIGDPDDVKANRSRPRLYDCLMELSTSADALDSRAVADTVKAIETALDGGGHAIAIVSIGLLLRKAGVLERLTASGISLQGS